MRNFLNRFWNDDEGFIVSAELLFLYTIAVLGLLTGMVAIRNAVIHEMVDVATSIASLDQSFAFNALTGCGAYTNGSKFTDNTASVQGAYNVTGDFIAGAGGTTVPITGTQAACP